ncbi:MAG: DegV family protein [Lachnospiraceae bacterium]|jgi:DegV family protein with EDD domain|nr:DegV family protein [Lachnospiraceae bacterium]
MNNAKTAVLIDSGCDVTAEICKKYDIRVMPLTIMYRDKCFSDTELEIEDPHYIYKHFKEEIPKTSALNTQEVLDAVKKAADDGYENVISVSISGAMSSTFSTVTTALNEAKEAGTLKKVFAFDSKNISIGAGIFSIWAAKLLQDGKSFEEVVQSLKDKIWDVHLCYYMDTLTYLAKGGRITPSVAIVGKLLNLKPIISCNHNGVYYTVAKIRGSSRGVEKLVEEMITPIRDASRCWICLMNGDGEALAETAKKMIFEKLPAANIIMEKQIVPSMAIHTGPGLLGIMVFSF